MASRNGSTFSVLGSDLAIRGDIQASADLHIDGSVEGDIACASLVQGETSTITGAVKAESARLAGTVHGSITARELVILKTAKITGDVFYDALTIEQGAQVEGRFAHRDARKPAAAPVQPAKAEIPVAN
ncbi:MAG: polymer-forming cytoskeletal protein [Erythrobacter sp.]|jgi:cytoskeletal protein CcmA (bactofilin family)